MTLCKFSFPSLFFFLFANNSFSQDWNKDLTPQQKIYTLSKVWKDVSENIAFFENVPTLNWDSLYKDYIPKALATKTKFEDYRLWERFICSLKDGHTFMFHFKEIFPHYKKYTFNNATLKIIPVHINKRVFLTRVGTQEMINTFPGGTEILEVNNKSVQKYLEENDFPYIAASTEHAGWNIGVDEMFRGLIDVPEVPECDVKYLKPDRKAFSMKLKLSDRFDVMAFPSYPESKLVDFKWLEDKIAYVELNTFQKDTIVTIFKSLIGILKCPKGIVIDLRGNGVCNSRICAEVLSYFTDAETLIGNKWITRETNAYFKANGYFARNRKDPDEEDKMFLQHYRNNSLADGGLKKYANSAPKQDRLRMPLSILTGNKTGSAAEDFLIMFAGITNRAIKIGQRTNGSIEQPFYVLIPTGGNYQICTKKDTYPDGRKFVGIGIIPDIEIEPAVEDVIGEKDVILNKAIEILTKKNSNSF